jgi:hypothetical protein
VAQALKFPLSPERPPSPPPPEFSIEAIVESTGSQKPPQIEPFTSIDFAGFSRAVVARLKTLASDIRRRA